MRASLVLLALLIGACNKDDPNPNDSEFGLDERPVNTTCLAPARPTEAADVAGERVFPRLGFDHPVALRQAPGDASRWYVLEQPGRVMVFDNDPDVAAASVALDIHTRVTYSGEAGLLGIAFHPAFASNGEVFLHYDTGSLRSRISRFRSTDGGATIDGESEEVLLEVDQPAGNHDGGDLHFGPDGHLYISLGDGGSAGDPWGNGQNPDTLLGAILRIDVDGGTPYAIPPGNPFARGGGAPEIYAWGLRNPWRMSFDMLTGDLWAADVGQNAWEEVDRIVNGGNYGWNTKEGNHCYATNPCDDPSFLDPVVEYPHSEGVSITGGYVYRGSAIPALTGAYLFADFAYTTIWGVFYDGETGEPFRQRLLSAPNGAQISAFGQDEDGEVYLVGYGGGLFKLVPGSAEVTPPFPQRLSETGCVDPADPTVPATGLIPYGVAMPLWSDAAAKRRWFALPEGATITADGDGDLQLPVGSVVMKEFSLGGTRLETRLMVHHDDGVWTGYTYKWDADGRDASLVRAGAQVEVGTQTWDIPSQAQCLGCHTTPAGSTLGLEAAQLAGAFTYPGDRTADQLATLAHIGVLDLDEADPFPPLGDGADAVRAYLHVNCASCHRPGASLGTDLDLRWWVPLADTALCAAPTKGDFGVDGALVVTPGDPSASVLALRMRTTGEGRMPNIGSKVVHDEGVAAVEAWISGLASCP